MGHPLSCRHNGRFEIWADWVARDNTSRNTHYCTVARHIGGNEGICADHHVITYSHAAYHLTSGTEINIVADGWPAGAADARDANTLIDCATVADSLGENEDTRAIVDN